MVDHIERELVLPAPPEEVWDVITGPGWLADEVRLDLTPGGEAYFRTADREQAGWIEEAVAPGDAEPRGARLVFWWSADGNPATRVELTLDPEDDDLTRVRVVESRPLEVLAVMGMPLPDSGGPSHEPTMLVAA
jgi:uncharacterized protein YndB with AHSA1/START domain